MPGEEGGGQSQNVINDFTPAHREGNICGGEDIKRVMFG